MEAVDLLNFILFLRFLDDDFHLIFEQMRLSQLILCTCRHAEIEIRRLYILSWMISKMLLLLPLKHAY